MPIGPAYNEIQKIDTVTGSLYRSIAKKKWVVKDSNLRPLLCQSSALNQLS